MKLPINNINPSSKYKRGINGNWYNKLILSSVFFFVLRFQIFIYNIIAISVVETVNKSKTYSSDGGNLGTARLFIRLSPERQYPQLHSLSSPLHIHFSRRRTTPDLWAKPGNVSGVPLAPISFIRVSQRGRRS
jgi:hypothetical protein